MGSFHVGGGEVVEDEGVFLEMASGEALFDAGLATEQPVHGVVEFVRIDIAEAEEFSEGGDGGFGGQGACGGEFGTGVDDAGDDEGDGEIAVPAGGAGDEGVEAESSEGSEDGGDVSVGEDCGGRGRIRWGRPGFRRGGHGGGFRRRDRGVWRGWRGFAFLPCVRRGRTLGGGRRGASSGWARVRYT